jgi:hypothetical protein
MAQATQKGTSSAIPKSSSFIDMYLRGALKKKKPRRKESKEPVLRGREALVAKYQKGEKMKGVRSAGIPGQSKQE